MNDEWHSLHEGDYEGRPVKLLVYSTGELRVETTQKNTESTEGSNEQGQIVAPMLFEEGDKIDIEADNATELEQELIKNGFSKGTAKDIARLSITTDT